MSNIDLGFTNLLVSGCSFTHSYNHRIQTWPYCVKDKTTIENVIDCSCPGAGNTHIQQSLIYKLETDQSLQPNNTLVVVMWSGYDRDDFIVDPRTLKTPYPDEYHYHHQASLGMTGGVGGESNLIVSIENVKKIKNLTSRALDNYVKIITLYYYLKERGFYFVFTEFSTASTRSDLNFDPVQYLDSAIKEKFVKNVRDLTPNLGDYALTTGNQSFDRYHPIQKDHEAWTDKILLPYLINLVNEKHSN
jgi:hypothetical protein